MYSDWLAAVRLLQGIVLMTQVPDLGVLIYSALNGYYICMIDAHTTERMLHLYRVWASCCISYHLKIWFGNGNVINIPREYLYQRYIGYRESDYKNRIIYAYSILRDIRDKYVKPNLNLK